jgi:predicted metal-binding membrane protein
MRRSVAAPAEALDTPRSALSLLGRRPTLVTFAVLVGVAAAAWALTVRNALSMGDMAMGLGEVGTRMPIDLTVPLFMAMWLTMMVAMMFPTVGPIVLAHRAVTARRGEGGVPTIAFVLGYLVVWTLIGLVPLGALVAVRDLPPETARSWWLPTISGVVLIVAGLYQFTSLKRICLWACRSPLGFIVGHDFGSGAVGAFRAGLSHGAYCLGCCWALMSVLVVVGLMNLVWMAILALIFLAEKNWRHGVGLSRAAGTAVALLGLAILAHPDLLTMVSGPGASGMGPG